VCKSGADAVYLLAYVDDLLMTGSRRGRMGALKQQLLAKFAARDLGPVSLFLGMEVVRESERRLLKLSQHKYVRELLEKYSMQNCAAVRSPLAAGAKLSREGEGAGDDLEAGVPYSELVGALLYLSVCTRPDIAYAVGLLARFMSAPKKQHWMAAKRVLRYLKGTPDLGICFWPHPHNRLEGFVDADFAGCISTRKSTTGYVFTLNGGAVCWSSKLQSVVALSTTEAEYIAAAGAVKEALWLQKLLASFDLNVLPVVIECDSQGALSLMQHVVASQRSKHIDVQFHFVRDRVAAGDVAFRYIASNHNIADCMTKVVPAEWHGVCASSMGLSAPLHAPPW
jgi:hypothetical protein